MRPRTTIALTTTPAALMAVFAFQATGTSLADAGANHDSGGQDVTEVTVHNTDGADVGTVTFEEGEDAVTVTADMEGLSPGFHGFHIHETGECDADADGGPFTTAGGHFAPDGNDHPEHAGDLPPLLATEDGTATLSLETDRFTLKDLADKDGSTVIVHSAPDNLGNVPERYLDGSAPDEDTLGTGDAGSRDACGVIAEPAYWPGARIAATPPAPRLGYGGV